MTNEWIARKSTLVFGTMWMFYAFYLYGLLPLIPSLSKYENAFFYWSGWVQLWALPLLMVGQVVLGRAAEERAESDHETLLTQFAELRQFHEERKQDILELQTTHQELVEMHEQMFELIQEIRSAQKHAGMA